VKTPHETKNTMNRPHVAVVGSANTDLTVVSPGLPGPGETVLGGRLMQNQGGKGANQAVAAARAGARVSFIGCVGDDDFGRTTLQALAGEGIETQTVRVDQEAASGVALIMVDETGENMISVASGANANLDAEDVRAARDAIAGADVLVAQLEIPLPAVEAALRIAQEAGVRVMLNPAPAPADPEALRALLPMVDYLVPNAGEAATLAATQGGDPRTLAAKLAENAGCTVIMTLGPEGACICERGACRTVPAPRVQALDTVGAGDCFCGALAVALGEGRDLEAAVRFAVHAAALSVQSEGAQPSMPHREAINESMTEDLSEDTR
jgi:ribokinase